MNRWSVRLAGAVFLLFLALVLFSLHRQLRAMADAHGTVTGQR